jgi:nucleoside recognition membrane protein YjiH
LLLFFLPNSPSSMWFPWGLCLFFFLSFPHGVELTCWFLVFLILGVFAAVILWLLGGDPLVFSLALEALLFAGLLPFF